jgi:hypothetical protein
VARKRKDPTVVDERDVEALPLPADIDAEPSIHASKHA